MLKAIVNSVALVVYLVVILDVQSCVFDNYDRNFYFTCERYVSVHVCLCVCLCVCICVCVHVM